MPDFTDTLETIRAEEADTRRLFGGDGTRVVSRANDPRYMEQLAEAADFIADVYDGRRPIRQLAEAMTTSDFPQLFGDVLDRQLVAAYRVVEPVWRAYAKESTVRDFRPSKRLAIDGAAGALERVAEKAPYPGAELSEALDTLQVHKYGKRLGFTWEDFVNDDLDALRRSPEQMAIGARNSEQRAVTELYVDSTGPHASLYDAAFGNVITGNPALTMAALQTAFTVLAAQKDPDGNPIAIDMVTLVVPPALEVVARNILNATELRIAAGSTSATADQLIVANWMRNRLTLVVDPFIPIVASSANGNSSWFLFANPNQGRAALEFAHLRGHTEPALFMKAPDARLISGTPGPDSDMADFDTDSVQYKVRHVYGGSRLTNTGGAKFTVASEGDNT